MSHLTSHSPATSVLKVRIWGHSGKGPVTSLPRGSLIATYLYYPRNYNPAYHSPVLAGVPDGWSFESADQLKAFSDRLLSTGKDTKDTASATLAEEMAGIAGPTGNNGAGLHAPSIRLQKTFVPLVLAEDVTVRKSSPNAAWADTYVSAALSGVTELHGKWCTGAGCNSGPPGVMFQGGEEFWVYLKFVGQKQHCILSAHPNVAARRGCLESYRQICKPLGEFVHPPLRLAFELDKPELISGVYIDPLTSRELRKKAGRIVVNQSGLSDLPNADGLVGFYERNLGTITDNASYVNIRDNVAGYARVAYNFAKDDAGIAASNNAMATYDRAITDFAGKGPSGVAAQDKGAVAAFAQASLDWYNATLKSPSVIQRFSDRGTVLVGSNLAEGRVNIRYPDNLKRLLGGVLLAKKGNKIDQSAALSGHGTTLVLAA